jgi:CHAT domain-containing protein
VFDKENEAKLIYEQMDSFASEMRGQSFCAQAATKEKYIAEVTNARLIHHHLHCVFSADNILKQSIVLTAPNQQPSTQPDNKPNDLTENGFCNGPASEALSALKQANDGVGNLLSNTDSLSSNLTVEEIFNLVLNSPLVVLVACESASQTISEGDEPLGLITGYLCAGAASVIGASWPIPSNAGRQFSKTFYREVLNSKSDFINLALMLQEAVLAIRDELSTSSTYHWGAFCLYGAWLFQPPWSRSEAV